MPQLGLSSSGERLKLADCWHQGRSGLGKPRRRAFCLGQGKAEGWPRQSGLLPLDEAKERPRLTVAAFLLVLSFESKLRVSTNQLRPLVSKVVPGASHSQQLVTLTAGSHALGEWSAR
jgi:hypothetical protein